MTRPIFISWHAMKRATQRRIKRIKHAEDKAAGRVWADCSLSKWLCLKANDAIDSGELLPSGRRSARYAHGGVVYVLTPDLSALKTVYPVDRDLEQLRAAPTPKAVFRKVRRQQKRERRRQSAMGKSPTRRVDAASEEYFEREFGGAA